MDKPRQGIIQDIQSNPIWTYTWWTMKCLVCTCSLNSGRNPGGKRSDQTLTHQSSFGPKNCQPYNALYLGMVKWGIKCSSRSVSESGKYPTSKQEAL